MSTDICRWIFLLLFLALWTKYSNSKEIRVVCYYTNWSVYRPGTAKFSPQNINPYLCTHLVYAFGGFTKENTLKPFDKYQDIEKGGYAKFTGLKTYNKNLKTLLAIGGWNEGSSRFSPMVANPDRRKELIKNAVKFLRQNHFDGLDLDWEYPSFRDGGKSRDKDNYAQLVQELREEFERESEKTGRPRLLLTMAVPAGIEYINKGYDVPKLTKYLDWMNILSYDYHSAFEPAVNHHAPLYSLEEPSEYNYDTELNIDYTIQHYLEKGADPNKLVLGIPTYGRSYTLFNPDANEIGAPADGPGDMGEATRENGYLAYYEICEYIKSQDWEVVQPNPDAMGPYAFKDNQWVGYDDDAIARKKAAYVAEKGLGGIMFWSIDNDDFRGNCHGKPYPIIEAAKEALISAYGLTDENLVSPPKPIKSKTRTRPQTPSKSTIEKETSEKKRVSIGSRRRNRIKTKTDDTTRSSSRSKGRRKQVTTTEGTIHSSLELVTPSYTTPAPPSTPDMAGGFKCEDEGFYPHPKDCKKYYWCLSGPGELGIIAHQFTCPAGLYFNKAADSCDYTRNVLCNKKLSKGTTTTTTTTTEASTSKTTSTARVPPKITAATSRTTVFRTSTTTEAYEDEYEYEDEDEEDIGENKNLEEDPKVIKELLDLIRKAGGIEQLEKQLKIHDDGSASVSHPDATTPSSISKSLVERVLNKAAAKNKADGKRTSYNFLNRNSRGPQNDGLKATEEKQTKERGRPQYTTITRQRSRVTETDEETEESENDDESVKGTNRKQPEYVNIRRGRGSTTTEVPEDSKVQINRNKILGEEDENEEQTTRKQYVNIRRQRPSSTEETSTSKYTVIRRGSSTEASISEDISNDKKRESTTPSSEDTTTIGRKRGTTLADDESSSDTTSKYKVIRRGSTTESSIDDQETTLSTKKRGSTSSSVQDVSEKDKTRATTISSTTSNDKYKILRRGSTTETARDTTTTIEDSSLKPSSTTTISTTQESEEDITNNPETENSVTTVEQLLITSPESVNVTITANVSAAKAGSKLSDSSGEGVYETQAPQLLQPRPFSLSTSGPTSSLKPVTESSTLVTKVSESNKYKLRLRQKPPSTQTDIISTTVLTTEKSTPFRTRAPSRFKLTTPRQVDNETSRPPVRARKRFSTTTEQYSDNYDEYDLNRTYRPSGIADLSSLTAVDFAALKELNKLSNPSRHRRVRPSTTTTTTQKPEENLKTSSRTLPLARQLLDSTTFGKSRRIIPSKKEPVLEDQINSSSDTTHRIRQFTRTTPTFSTITSTTEETTRQTLRNRKVIRRLRPTGVSKLRNQNNNSQISLRKSSVRSNSTNSTETENLIENASVNSLYSRRYSRPSTTLAEVTNELSTTTEVLEKRSTELPKEEDDQNETAEDVSAEEGENIKLSESNIRENSNVNNDNVLSSDEGKKLKRKILKRIKSKVDEDEKITTEPNVIIRTRKIIRKLKPTESTILTSTTESTDVSTKGRKRKIIRRLRPITTSTEELSSSSEISTTQKNLYIRGRPFIRHSLNEKTEDEKEKATTALPSNESESVRQNLAPIKNEPTKYNKYKSKYKTIARTTPVAEDASEDFTSEESIVEKTTKEPLVYKIDRSKYSSINRGTTSTTTKYNDNDLSKDNEEEEEETNVSNQPRYRIYRPTIFHDEDDEIIDEEVIDDEGDNFSTKSPKYRILNPILSTNNETKPDEENINMNYSKSVEEQLIANLDINLNEKSLTNDTKNEENSSTQNGEVETLTTSTEDSTTPVDIIEDSTEIQENDWKQNVTLSGDKNETSINGETEEGDNEEIVTTTTTLRTYVNPILSRQKNRPTYKKPKLTTQNPLKTTSSGSKFKYRAFSRSTTHTPKRIIVVTEENQNNEQEKERQFVPKNARNRFSSYTENKTEPSSNTVSSTTTEFSIDTNATEFNVENENNATTEVYDSPVINATNVAITTDAAEITTLYEHDFQNIYNVTTPELDSDSNVTERSSTEVQPSSTEVQLSSTEIEPNTEMTSDTTTEKIATIVYEMNTILREIEITNHTEIDSTVSPEVTTLTEIEVNTVENDTNEDMTVTTDRIETSSVTVFNTTTETTTPYQPKSTLRSIQNRPRYNAPKKLTRTESSTVATRASARFNKRNRGQSFNSRLVTPNLRSTTPSSPLRNKAIYKYSTTERTKPTEEFENDDNNYENTEDDDEEIEEETDKLYTPRTPSSYTPQTSYKPRIGSKPSFRRTTEIPKDLEKTPENKKYSEKETDDDDNNYENREGDDEEIEEETDKLYTPRTPSSYTSQTNYKPRIGNKPSFRRTTEIPKDLEETPENKEYLEKETDEQVYTPKNNYTPRSKSKPRISNRPEAPSFRKTTEAPKVTEDLGDIDTEAVKNRNKNLFSKKRKMNTPFAGYSQNNTTPDEEKSVENTDNETTSGVEENVATTERTTPATILTTTPLILESVTKPSTNAFETTEYLTTLHHVFAETENVTEKGSETTTISTVQNKANKTNSKIEKLIEVNRIVEIHEMNKTDEQKENKVIDKVGVINRVTVVKVVDGNLNPEENEIIENTSEITTLLPNEKNLQTGAESGEIEIATVKEIPNQKIKGGLDAIVNPFELSPERQDRKFEIYGQSRIIDYSSKDTKTQEKSSERFDGRSNINIITPRPYYSTEASTISLEALFQTDTPQKLNANLLKPSNDDELLETGNSRYVNVRILDDQEKQKDESRLIPVKVLKDEDYITMKAQVVEVTPKITKDVIKIVPIQVEMSRKLIAPSDFHTQLENGVPKVNLHILKSEDN